MNLKEVKNTVSIILIEEPETRDNDKLLIIRYFERTYGHFNKELFIETNESCESITRFRRLLQEDPKYWGQHKTRAYRKWLSKFYVLFLK